MKIIFIFLVFFTKIATANEIRCLFEEVYKDGLTQNGFFLFQKDQLRYQYFDNNLFTIYKKESGIFIQRNDNRQIIQKVNENTETIERFFEILKDYPQNNSEFFVDPYNINLEKSMIFDFYKRVSIKSIDLNLSIYLKQCYFDNLNIKFFNYNPFFEYKFISK